MPKKRFCRLYKPENPAIIFFTVKGSNNDGIWNEQGISVILIIKPPWWKNPVFQNTGICFVDLFLIWILVNFEIRSIRKKTSQ